MKELRILASSILLLLAASIVVMNWWCVVLSRRNRKRGIDRHHSTVPLVSLMFAGLAYPMFPLDPKGWIGVIPALDIGNWFLLWLPVALFRDRRE